MTNRQAASQTGTQSNAPQRTQYGRGVALVALAIICLAAGILQCILVIDGVRLPGYHSTHMQFMGSTGSFVIGFLALRRGIQHFLRPKLRDYIKAQVMLRMPK